MNEFKTYHPIVNFTYFLAVIGFSMFYMHPLSIFISFVCAFSYSVVLNGKRAVKTNLVYMLPTVIVAALMNPAFNHEGVTILTYLPGGNPLTLEAIAYGFMAAVVIVSVICWFSCYNEVMTSDKFIYLFGKIIPSLSLILSMTLRFVPKFAAQLKTVSDAQKCIGRSVTEGRIIQRIKNGITILSIMVTWALESSVETADSMKARGYGIPGRTAFSIFKFDKRDAYALLLIAALSVYVILGSLQGAMSFEYYPFIKGAEFSYYGASVFAAYLALCVMPIVIEAVEVIRWKRLKSRV